MATRAWYIDWFSSPFYHKLYFEHDESDARAFIQKLINHLHPLTPSRMLDVACGRGRHSKILSSFGHQVTGIDISLASIDYARQFENENLEFYQHDMRLPFRTNYYDYAFNFFTSFGYFFTERENADAVRTIAGSLKQNGLFIIDYLNVHYAEDHFIPAEEKNINGTLYTIRRWNDETHFYKTITIHDHSLPNPQTFTEKVSKLSLGDFTDMLAFYGMQVQEVFGDYGLNKYDVRKTPRLILIAKKEK